MIRFLEYTLIFIAVVLSQVLLFNNLYIDNIVIINITALFIIILPFQIPSWIVLFLSALLGVVIDIFSGTPGINTIASVAVGFLRAEFIPLVLGRGEETLRGAISSGRLPLARYLIFIILLILIQNIIVFSLESLSFNNILQLVIRIVSSTFASVVFVYMLQFPLFKKER